MHGLPTWVNAYISRAVTDNLIHVQPDAVNGTHLIQSLHKTFGLPMRPVTLTLHSPLQVHGQTDKRAAPGSAAATTYSSWGS